MTLPELLRWQWDGYPRYHRSRANLLLHIVVVPLFLGGNLAIVLGMATLSWAPAAVGIAATRRLARAAGPRAPRRAVAARALHGPAERGGAPLLRAVDHVPAVRAVGRLAGRAAPRAPLTGIGPRAAQ